MGYNSPSPRALTLGLLGQFEKPKPIEPKPIGPEPEYETIEPDLEAEAEEALKKQRTLRGRRSLRIDPAVRTSGGTGVGIPPA